MIRIIRGKPPENTVLDKNKKKALKKVGDDISKKNFSSKSFNTSLWRNKTVKEFIYNAQYGKCCYCERLRDVEAGDSDVEHFRPKTKVSDCEEHSGYWWLAYEWANLLISCKVCNSKKKNQFPLQDESQRVYDSKGKIEKEIPLLINPLEENPEDFIEYDVDGSSFMAKAVGKCDRGKKTVDYLTGINNRRTLMERRKKLLEVQDAVRILEKLGDEESLKRKLSEDSTFLGLVRFYLKRKGFA